MNALIDTTVRWVKDQGGGREWIQLKHSISGEISERMLQSLSRIYWGGGNHLLHLLAGITSKCNLTDLGDGSSVSRDVQMKRTGVNIHFEEGPTVR